MIAREIIKAALKDCGATQADLAAAIGISPDTFSKKLLRDTLTASEFYRAADALGMRVSLHRKRTGQEVEPQKFRPGVMPSTSMMVGGVTFDTAKADAMCHTGCTDGITLELYRDYRRCYFVAIRAGWDNGRVILFPCDAKFARKLYSTHRDVSDDPPEVAFASGAGFERLGS